MERQVSAAASGEKDAIVRLPFAGLKVLDLSRVLAGPYCCALLGEAGASVVKVERPGAGDENRRWGHLWHGESLDFMNVNRNKRGITVNLHHPEGQEIIRKLAADADVVVESFVPGTMEKFHLDYESLKPLNPRMVYCSISAFGLQGPLRSKSGYDGALQAFSGHMSITGELEGGPVRTGASIIDMGTGITAYAAVTTALLGRQLSGNGQKVSVSLLQTALSLMGSHAAVSWKAYQRSATATGLYAGVHSGIAEQPENLPHRGMGLGDVHGVGLCFCHPRRAPGFAGAGGHCLAAGTAFPDWAGDGRHRLAAHLFEMGQTRRGAHEPCRDPDFFELGQD